MGWVDGGLQEPENPLPVARCCFQCCVQIHLSTLRLIIVDTKIVEYADFDGIPHLCQPICAGVDSAMRSLAWLASEIERREHLKNAIDMNSLRYLHKRLFGCYRRGKPIKLPPGTHEIFPDIVVVIDEFSDLLHFTEKKLRNCS